MREPPVDLSANALCAALLHHYGLAVDAVTFLPLGQDSSAWVYRVQTGSDAYFLKVRRNLSNRAGLLVPRYLVDRGIAEVIAPLPTTTQTLTAHVGDYALILYPFVSGTTGMDSGMSALQWIDYGAVLHAIHAVALPPDLAHLLDRETFVPVGAGLIRNLQAHIGERVFADPAARGLAAFWRERRDGIQMLAKRAEDLGRRLRQRAPALVLCHADIHTGNVLIDADGQVRIVDWDETILAPKERDLMFVAGGGISDQLVGPRDEELFFQGYGSATLDPLALAYYRYAWAAGDIGAYGAEVFLRPDLGEITRLYAAERFVSLFQPGEIVARALASPYR